MSNARTLNSARNIVYRLISQVANILLKFVSRSIFIYTLGVEYLGINGLFSEILTMLSLADLGFGTAMVFSMYKPLAESDHVKLTQLVALYKRIYRMIAIAITIIGLCLIPFLPYLVNLEEPIPHLEIYYILYLANTVASYLVVYKTCILIADQKNYLISKYDTIFSLLSTIGCAILLILTRNFMVYLITQVVFTYSKNFYQSHVANKMYPYINDKASQLPKKEEKQIFDNVKSVFIYKFATTLVGSTDNTLISILTGTITVGYYSNYSMVITNVTMFMNIIFSSVTASIGNLVVQNDKKKNYDVYKIMQFVSFVLSSFVITSVYLLINDFIKVWIGEQYLLDNLVVIAIVINMYFSVVLMPIWSYREATGMYRQTKYIMVITAIVNLVMSIILGKMIGLAGILFATSIARISTYFWYEPKLLFTQFFEKNVVEYYIGIGKNVIITLIVIGVSSLIYDTFFINSWFGLIIKACCIGATSMIFTLLLYCRNPYFVKCINMLKSLLHKG